MAKAYFCVLDRDSKPHSAIVDLDNLPPGATSNVVLDFRHQGSGLGAWLNEDLNRAVRVTDNLKNSIFDVDAVFVISMLASFLENAPPVAEEKHLIVGVTHKKVDIIRTSEDAALDAWSKFQKLSASTGQ